MSDYPMTLFGSKDWNVIWCFGLDCSANIIRAASINININGTTLSINERSKVLWLDSGLDGGEIKIQYIYGII